MGDSIKGMISMIIRKAQIGDIDGILKLLSQVLEVHAKIRPDLFVSGTVKYSRRELEEIIADTNTPVFVAAGEDNSILGHAFTQISVNTSQNMPKGMRSMYIDDICVDIAARRQSVGRKLFEYCISYAKELGVYDVSLNVWEGNDTAERFYKAMGMTVRKTTLEYIIT